MVALMELDLVDTSAEPIGAGLSKKYISEVIRNYHFKLVSVMQTY